MGASARGRLVRKQGRLPGIQVEVAWQHQVHPQRAHQARTRAVSASDGSAGRGVGRTAAAPAGLPTRGARVRPPKSGACLDVGTPTCGRGRLQGSGQGRCLGTTESSAHHRRIIAPLPAGSPSRSPSPEYPKGRRARRYSKRTTRSPPYSLPGMYSRSAAVAGRYLRSPRLPLGRR